MADTLWISYPSDRAEHLPGVGREEGEALAKGGQLPFSPLRLLHPVSAPDTDPAIQSQAPPLRRPPRRRRLRRSPERERAKTRPKVAPGGSTAGEPVQGVAALQDRLDISLGDLRRGLFRDPGLDLGQMPSGRRSQPDGVGFHARSWRSSRAFLKCSRTSSMVRLPDGLAFHSS